MTPHPLYNATIVIDYKVKSFKRYKDVKCTMLYLYIYRSNSVKLLKRFSNAVRRLEDGGWHVHVCSLNVLWAKMSGLNGINNSNKDQIYFSVDSLLYYNICNDKRLIDIWWVIKKG